jgi:hypothetical protein
MTISPTESASRLLEYIITNNDMQIINAQKSYI